MPHKSNLRHQLAQKIGLCLILGAVVWTVLLMQGARIVRLQGNDTSLDIAFGPWVLNRIGTQTADGGYHITFTFEAGLLWYALFWVAAGTLIALFFAYSQKRSAHRR